MLFVPSALPPGARDQPRHGVGCTCSVPPGNGRVGSSGHKGHIPLCCGVLSQRVAMPCLWLPLTQALWTQDTGMGWPWLEDWGHPTRLIDPLLLRSTHPY